MRTLVVAFCLTTAATAAPITVVDIDEPQSSIACARKIRRTMQRSKECSPRRSECRLFNCASGCLRPSALPMSSLRRFGSSAIRRR